MTNPSQRPDNTTQIADSRIPHGELIDGATGRAWISLEPMEPHEYEGLALPEGFMPVDHGSTAMDEHWFTRSPDEKEDGPMQLRDIGRHTFGHCARSLGISQPFGPTGPMEVRVEKHHGGHFAKGRRIAFLVDAAGQRFVHIVDRGQDPEALELPEGFKVEWLELDDDWSFLLPTPTTAYFFGSGDSFQGPIEMPATADSNGRSRE